MNPHRNRAVSTGKGFNWKYRLHSKDRLPKVDNALIYKRITLHSLNSLSNIENVNHFISQVTVLTNW